MPLSLPYIQLSSDALTVYILAEEFWRPRKTRQTGRSLNTDSTALLTQGQQHLCCCALLRTHPCTHRHALLDHRPRGARRERATTPSSFSLCSMRLCHAGYPLCRFHTCVNERSLISRIFEYLSTVYLTWPSEKYEFDNRWMETFFFLFPPFLVTEYFF